MNEKSMRNNFALLEFSIDVKKHSYNSTAFQGCTQPLYTVKDGNNASLQTIKLVGIII